MNVREIQGKLAWIEGRLRGAIGSLDESREHMVEAAVAVLEQVDDIRTLLEGEDDGRRTE